MRIYQSMRETEEGDFPLTVTADSRLLLLLLSLAAIYWFLFLFPRLPRSHIEL